MADYQKMYTALFNAVTDAIVILQAGQQQSEEIYISGEDTVLTVLEKPKTDDEQNNKGGDQN